MSLQALLAKPVRKSRRPRGRPFATDAATARDHLEALRLRVCLKLSEEKAAGALGISKPTLRAWCRKAMKLPESRQIFADESRP